jgi:hypothetical protein
MQGRPHPGQHALEFAASAWKGSVAKSRVSTVETLSRVVPVVVRDLAGAPDPAVLRGALRKKINQGSHAGTLTEDEAKAIAWLDKASRPMSAFEDAATVCDGQLKAIFRLVTGSAPSRIRTYAHGSGGRCCAAA